MNPTTQEPAPEQGELTTVINHQKADNLAAFKKTGESWGGFSNMAGGFLLTVSGMNLRSSEALYQA